MKFGDKQTGAQLSTLSTNRKKKTRLQGLYHPLLSALHIYCDAVKNNGYVHKKGDAI
jgi:hypothetical protein